MKTNDFINSVPVSYAIPLLEDLGDLGCDLKAIWERAAMHTPLADIANSSALSLPASEFTRLYRCCMEELERQSCAREGRRPLGKPAVDLLCFSVLPCRTLREVIHRVIQFNTVMEERGGDVGLDEQDGLAIFSMRVSWRYRDNPALLVDITGLFFYFQLFSWLISRRIPLKDVRVAHEAPRKPYPLLELFDLPVTFEASANQLIFPAECLDEPAIRTVAELEKIIDYFPFDLSVGTSSKRASAAQLRFLILDAIQNQHEVPALETAAQLFHVSPATLRRRLHDSGTSYREIRAACQKEVAEQLLLNPELSVEMVAEGLGFGSDRAFRRAFLAWTGKSPSEFRRRG